MAIVREVHVVPDKCICHECCIDACPQVFEMDPDHATIRVRVGAEEYFASHSAQILEAVWACPVRAIWASVDRD